MYSVSLSMWLKVMTSNDKTVCRVTVANICHHSPPFNMLQCGNLFLRAIRQVNIERQNYASICLSYTPYLKFD